MSPKAIDPSEILTNGQEPKNSSHPAQSTAWIRFLARMVDYFLFFCALRAIHAFFSGPAPFGRWEFLIPFEYFVWIPIEALFLTTWGKTPGKWFLHIDIQQGRRARPDYLSALTRSFHVWLRGLGMAIPFINFLCLFVAYHRLKLLHTTSWDRDGHFQVSHGFVPQWRLVIASIMTFLVMVFYIVPK